MCQVRGLQEFRVSGLGFRVSGLGFRARAVLAQELPLRAHGDGLSASATPEVA